MAALDEGSVDNFDFIKLPSGDTLSLNFTVLGSEFFPVATGERGGDVATVCDELFGNAPFFSKASFASTFWIFAAGGLNVAGNFDLTFPVGNFAVGKSVVFVALEFTIAFALRFSSRYETGLVPPNLFIIAATLPVSGIEAFDGDKGGVVPPDTGEGIKISFINNFMDISALFRAWSI